MFRIWNRCGVECEDRRARVIIQVIYKYMNPTVGRIVFYKARGSADGVFPKVDRAAVVTDVRISKDGGDIAPDEYQVRLCVLNPEGMFFTSWLDQGQEGGQWDWPARV